jgi:hypothetical protein
MVGQVRNKEGTSTIPSLSQLETILDAYTTHMGIPQCMHACYAHTCTQRAYMHAHTLHAVVHDCVHALCM